MVGWNIFIGLEGGWAGKETEGNDVSHFCLHAPLESKIFKDDVKSSPIKGLYKAELDPGQKIRNYHRICLIVAWNCTLKMGPGRGLSTVQSIFLVKNI